MTIEEFNNLSKTEQEDQLKKCCGATHWVNKMLDALPFVNMVSLLECARKIWWECSETDWLEAFTHHPRIGNREVLSEKFATTTQWAAVEQEGAATASKDILDELLQGNRDYEKKFGFIFIVCATGKTAVDILSLLQSRFSNEKEKEIKIAAEEQNKIIELRLKKLLA